MNIFTLYCPDGTVVKAKRGIRIYWKENIVSLLSVRNGNISVYNDLHNVEKWKEEPSESHVILIESPHQLRFSSVVEFYDTTIDIDKDFLLHSYDYSPLLRRRYHSTLFPKLYRLAERRNILRPFWRGLLFLCNIVNRRYFYIVSCDDRNMDVSFESCISKNRIFVLEFHAERNDNLPVGGNPLREKVNAILSDFYAKAGNWQIDYIVRYEKFYNEMRWYVILLDSDVSRLHGFMNARLVMYFRQYDNKNTEILLGQLVKMLGSRHVDSSAFVDSGKGEHPFNVYISPCLSFVYFVDGTGRNCQRLYSPLVNGDTGRLSVRVQKSKSDGYLLTSLLPLEICAGVSIPARKISDDIIRLQSSRTEIITVCDNTITFLGKKYSL